VKKSEWSDKQLEELLRQMPKIKDDRHPRDIYQNISPNRKRKPLAWLIPVAATVAALLLIILLIPNLMVGNNLSLDKSTEDKAMVTEKSNDVENKSSILMKQEEASLDNGESGAETKIMMQSGFKTALYDYEVGDQKVLTYWIPDPMGQILVPISTMVNQAENDTWLSLFNQSMGQLTEEEWGLTDYYPLNATISYESGNNIIAVDVPANHNYGQGSTNETNFINVLISDFSSNSSVNKIWLKTNGQPGIEFGNHGILNEIAITPSQNRAYFFYHPDGSDIPLMVPVNNEYTDIQAALEAMKTDQSVLGLKASLESSFSIKEVAVKNNKLMITMDERSKIADDLNALYSFEAILLTAKEFGFQSVVIMNSPINQLGPFDLTQEIKVPIGANFRPIQ
jgi:hypothetical protein